jgi:hypothetical protein
MATRRARAEWERVIGELERSGQSVQRFAGARGLNPSTLGWWRWRLRAEGGVTQMTRFMPVVLEGAAQLGPTESIEVALPSGVVLRFAHRLDRDGLRELAAAFADL